MQGVRRFWSCEQSSMSVDQECACAPSTVKHSRKVRELLFIGPRVTARKFTLVTRPGITNMLLLNLLRGSAMYNLERQRPALVRGHAGVRFFSGRAVCTSIRVLRQHHESGTSLRQLPYWGILDYCGSTS